MLGEKIKKARIRARMSVQEAARAAKISKVYWYQIEQGRKMPRLEVLERMAYALQKRLEYFFKK